jgi:LPS sulfotransferase NodH
MKLRTSSFLILAEVRTGGTMLTTALDGHSQLSVLGEVLDSGPGCYWQERRRPIVEALYDKPDKFSPDSNLVPLINHLFAHHDGFLVHRQWQIADNNPTWAYLAALSDLKVIHLHRENLFKQYASEQLALATNVWHLEQASQQRPDWRPIAIDVDHCLWTLRQRQRYFAWGRAQFAGHPQLVVRYEDIQQDVQSVLTYCQGFLGVPLERLTVRHRKLVNRPIKELIGNQDKVRARLRGTEYAAMFEEALADS